VKGEVLGAREGGREGEGAYLVDIARVEPDGMMSLRLHVLEGQVVIGHLGKREERRERGMEGGREGAGTRSG